MSRRRRSRLLAAGVMLGGLVSVGAGAVGIATAHAAAPPGSNFGALDITATAAGVRVPFYSHSGEDVEAEIPWSASTMGSGGVGHAITSLFWPGDTGGHGGDTLFLLGAPCIPPNPQGLIPLPVPCLTHAPQPPQSVYQALNDPYKAEAQTGTGQPTVTQTSPGVNMSATATAPLVAATTSVDGSKVPTVGDVLGATASTTSIRLTGPNTAVVDAMSTIHDISLAGGSVTISAVTSVGHAVTNGKTATGTATTTVSGMKIGGVAVTVDNKGVHLAGAGAGLPATDALNALLTKTGIQVFVAPATRKLSGSSVSLDAGNLVISLANSGYTSNANDTGRVLILGGVGIQASSGLGFPYVPLPAVAPPPSTGASGGGAGGVTGGTGGGTTPTLPALGQQGTTTGVPPVVAAAHESSLPHGGVPAGFVVLVAFGSAVVAAGLRLMPDKVLAVAGTACTQGGTA